MNTASHTKWDVASFIWLTAILGIVASLGTGNALAHPILDSNGEIETVTSNPKLDTDNAFFQNLGTNGRTCGTCHVQRNAFGLNAAEARARFVRTGGSDPLFASVDGANCPNVVAGDRAGHSLMLNNGLVRVFLPMPANPQFTLTAVHDPYGCALTTDDSGQQTVSVYRRPLPATNLSFLSSVMFDGRETVQPLNSVATYPVNLVTDLSHQALDATLGHAQAAKAPTPAQLASIVNFEIGLNTAQVTDLGAKSLTAEGATGGPANLAQQLFYPGINDSLGGDPTGAAFNPVVFTIFNSWGSLTGSDPVARARESVARGENIFNTRRFNISDVPGLVTGSQVLSGTCTTCHDTPNVGNHSFPLPLDIGVSHSVQDEIDPQIAAGLRELSQPDLPIYQVTCTVAPFTVLYTSDPGKALISGQCADVGRGKGLILRGLPARAPYFHNGAAANLSELVKFYNQRFQINLSAQDQADLEAFLDSL